MQKGFLTSLLRAAFGRNPSRDCPSRI